MTEHSVWIRSVNTVNARLYLPHSNLDRLNELALGTHSFGKVLRHSNSNRSWTIMLSPAADASILYSVRPQAAHLT